MSSWRAFVRHDEENCLARSSRLGDFRQVLIFERELSPPTDRRHLGWKRGMRATLSPMPAVGRLPHTARHRPLPPMFLPERYSYTAGRERISSLTLRGRNRPSRRSPWKAPVSTITF